MFLIDSGAQYPDGTTDVTRTVIVGAPTAEMRDRFTRVLKGHIALATARFPEGTIGMQLDSFARRPLWEAGLDYDHGTGHGVGSYLSVHEGPQNISKRPVNQPLKPGMICSNEPGYLQDRRIRHPHRESGGGDRAEADVRRRAADDGLRNHHPGADRSQSGRAVACSPTASAPGSTPITRGCARRLRRWWMKKRAAGWNRRRGRSDAGAR